MNVASNPLKQPPVFRLAYYTTMCERIGFYVISYLIVMYLRQKFGLTDTQSFLIFGVFTALAYLTPALGGFLGDNVIGIRRSIVLGLFFEGTGLILLTIPSFFAFTVALAFVIVGAGFFKTSPTDLLAHSYHKKDPRIDAGFTYYYMAINIGTVVAGIVASFVQKYYGWNIAFLTGGLLLYLGLVFYYILRRSAEDVDTKAGSKPLPYKTIFLLLLGIMVSICIFVLLLFHTEMADIFFIASTLLTMLYFLFEIIKSPKEEKWHIGACLYLIIVGLGCAILYFQLFTSIELFIKRAVIRTYFGFTVPTVIYLALESVFVVMLGPILIALYNYLNKRNKDMDVFTKLTLGLLATSLSFFFLVVGAHYPNSQFQISSLWIIGMLFIFTIGDLLNSALGVAMVTHLAPKRMYGVMMGTWFLMGNALAASLSGESAGLANITKLQLHDASIMLHIYSAAFTKIGIAGIIASVIAFMLNPLIKRKIKLYK